MAGKPARSISGESLKLRDLRLRGPTEIIAERFECDRAILLLLPAALKPAKRLRRWLVHCCWFAGGTGETYCKWARADAELHLI